MDVTAAPWTENSPIAKAGWGGAAGSEKPALFSPETCAGFVKVPDGNAGELGRS